MTENTADMAAGAEKILIINKIILAIAIIM